MHTLSLRSKEIEKRLCLSLKNSQSVLDHLQIVIASLDQLLVAIVASVVLLGKEGRQVEPVVHNARHIIRPAAVGADTSSHQLFHQHVMWQVEIDRQVHRDALFHSERLDLVTGETIQNDARLVDGLSQDLRNDWKNDVVGNETSGINIRLHRLSKLGPLRHFLLHVIARAEYGKLRLSVQSYANIQHGRDDPRIRALSRSRCPEEQDILSLDVQRMVLRITAITSTSNQGFVERHHIDSGLEMMQRSRNIRLTYRVLSTTLRYSTCEERGGCTSVWLQ